MGLNQLKNVKWSDDERVDLDDLSALSTLKDADLREYLLGLFEPGTYGRVLKGFDAAWSSGPQYDHDNGVDSLAIASDGSLLEIPTSAAPSVALAPNATNYIHAYLIEQDSDLDNRRFLNDIPVPPEEVTQNVATRRTKVVGLYVVSNSDVTPLLGSFQTSAFISGATRQLVALYAMKTDAFNVTSTVDFRHMWLPGGNYIAPANGGTSEFPMTVNATTVNGLRTMFRAIASVFQKYNEGTNDQWWDTTPLLTDLVSGTAQTTLRRRNAADKSVTATVSPTVGLGDYTTLAAALTAVNTGEIRLKAGTHLVDTQHTIANKAGLLVCGESPHSTVVRFNNSGAPSYNPSSLLIGANNQRVTFKSLRFISVNDGSGSLNPFFTFSATGSSDITFEDCIFDEGLTVQLQMTVANPVTRLRFVNCTFKFGTGGVGFIGNESFFTSQQWVTTDFTEFIDCVFTPAVGAGFDSTPLLGTSFGTDHQPTNLSFTNCVFGASGGQRWMMGTMTTTAVTAWKFRGCTFWEIECINYCGGAATINTQQSFWDCEFLTTTGTMLPLYENFNGNSYNLLSSYGHFWNCRFLHDGFARTNGNGIGSMPRFRFEGCSFERLTSGTGASWFNYYDYGSVGGATGGGPAIYMANCQLWSASLTTYAGSAIHIELASTTAGTFRPVFEFHGVSFHYGTGPGQNSIGGSGTSSYNHILVRHNPSAACSGVTVIVDRCVFHNTDATALPLKFSKNANGGEGNFICNYVWRNGTDGTVTDTGVDSAGLVAPVRLSDSPVRMLTT